MNQVPLLESQSPTPLPRALRDYQVYGLNQLRRCVQAGYKRIVLKLPTGGGKTLVATEIIKNHVAKGGKPMFCVDSITLIDQTAQVLCDDGIEDIGIIQADHPMTNPHARVQIASIQTLARRRVPADVTLIIVDECHCCYDSMYKLMESWDNTIFIGLTATPYAKGMGKHWEQLVTISTTEEMTDNGYLSPFVVYAPESPDLSKVKITAGDYNEGQLSEVMQDKVLVGNMLTHWQKMGTLDKTLAFCVDRAHAKAVANMFNSHHVPCGYSDAYTTMDERRELGEKLKRGELKVISNCGTLTKGVNWDIRTIILARPTKSHMLYQQIVGRALRVADGKDKAIIIDMSSTTLNLGMVTDFEGDFIELDDGRKKKSQSTRETPEKLPKECPSCHALKPAGVHKCPHCGFAPEKVPTVEHRRGELVEFSGKKKSTAAEKRNRQHSREEKSVFLGEMRLYARQKGYAPGWASHKYRQNYSVWPNKIEPARVEEIRPETFSWIRAQQIRYAKRKVV